MVLERKNLADQIFIHIKEMILSQELKCGESIPEEKIAKFFGVSRTPIRETLRKLEKYGLVTIKPHSQAMVIELGAKEAHYIGEVRSVIETLAIRNLAKRADAEDIKNLRDLAQKCVTTIKNGNSGEAFEIDNLFHLEIAKRSGNPYIYTFLKSIEAKIQLIRIMSCGPKFLNIDVQIHFQIIDAIERHDSKTACSLMHKHIGDFIRHTSPEKKVTAPQHKKARNLSPSSQSEVPLRITKPVKA